MSYELWISFRYLISRRKEKFISIISFISIMGVALGVTALIVVLAVMSGFDNDLREKIVGTNSHIIIEKEGGITDYNAVVAEINKIPHVKASSPFINGQALIRQDEQVLGVVLRGIDPAREKDVTNIQKYLESGTIEVKKDTVLIGKELSLKLGLKIGDAISLISAADPKPKSFKIAGIFNSGMFEYDMNLVFTNLEGAQNFYNTGNMAGGIGVRVDDVNKADNIKKDVQEKIGFDYWVRSWSELNKNLFSALKLEKITMFIILALIVVVACFNIASTLIMMVMEKTKDIGILKSIGADNKSIRKIFMLDGFLIGFAGTVLGAIGGFGISYLLKTYQFIKLPKDIYYIDRLPVNLEMGDAITVIAAAMIISLLSTLYPSWQAAKMEPVEALRYE
ncbi:MAG: lipoprotein-releasing system transmembrane subunit LolC [Candidatus Omnitrophica bacterium CG22_combo_CG10-13_8_21_14_all_43_16]|nr:MAG: lipoprotein-releasing system transmembrane subunit LolC [Candidatus Omnitrophica bacterium CG22_combo_CG10-13_8_21_14_all_43_16]